MSVWNGWACACGLNDVDRVIYSSWFLLCQCGVTASKGVANAVVWTSESRGGGLGGSAVF